MNQYRYKLITVVCASLLANASWSVMGVGDVVHDPIIFQQNLQQWLERIEQWKHEMEAYEKQLKLLKGSKKYGAIAEQLISNLPQNWNEVMPNASPDLAHTREINENKSDFLLNQFKLMINAYNDSKNRLERIQSIVTEIDRTEGPKEAADLNNRLQAEAIMMQENQNRLQALQSNFAAEEKLSKHQVWLKNMCRVHSEMKQNDSRVEMPAECMHDSVADNHTRSASTKKNSDNSQQEIENSRYKAGIYDKGPNGGWQLGQTSEKYESGGKGAGTINGAKAAAQDRGGMSYGKYQIATNTGTMNDYLKNSKYKDEFKGLKPGTQAFNDKWKAVAKRDPNGFGADQHRFIERTHYQPQMNKLKKNGIDLSNRSPAVQDAVWSTSVQYNNKTQKIFGQALKGKDVSKMSDAQIINAVQNNKIARTKASKNKESVKKSVLKRIENERKDLLKLTK